MLFWLNSAYFSEIHLMCDGRTDRPTDGSTDKPSYKDAKTHLKMRNDGGVGISLSQFSKKLWSYKEQRVIIGKNEIRISTHLLSFHLLRPSVVRIYICMIVPLSITLSVYLFVSVLHPSRGAAKTSCDYPLFQKANFVVFRCVRLHL